MNCACPGARRAIMSSSIPGRSVHGACLRTWRGAGQRAGQAAQLYRRAAANAAFRDDVPYVYAVVQLDEGPRLVSNIVQCDIDTLRVDMPLEAVFDDVTPEWTLVKFKPA